MWMRRIYNRWPLCTVQLGWEEWIFVSCFWKQVLLVLVLLLGQPARQILLDALQSGDLEKSGMRVWRWLKSWQKVKAQRKALGFMRVILLSLHILDRNGSLSQYKLLKSWKLLICGVKSRLKLRHPAIPIWCILRLEFSKTYSQAVPVECAEEILRTNPGFRQLLVTGQDSFLLEPRS